MNRARLVLFTDRRIWFGPYLARAFVAAAAARGNVEVVAVVDTATTPFDTVAAARALAERLGRRAFDPAHPFVRRPSFDGLASALRRRGVPLLVPAARDVNADAFVRGELAACRADYALSLVCLQIFGTPLLGAFRRAINYHNGALPAFRGLNATAWSVYRGAAATAFSFHWMTEGIDRGAVVATGAIPVDANAGVAGLEWRKTQLAAAAAGRVLDALVAGDAGVPQTGPAAYYGRAAWRSVTSVADPSSIGWDELQLRIRAFGRVRLRLAGVDVDATRVRRQRAKLRRPELGFVTADGIDAEVDRVGFLPPSIARVLGRGIPR